MAGVLGLAASLAALDALARPALVRATAWRDEDRGVARPSPLELDRVDWELEGRGARATLAARRLELAAPSVGPLALNARRRPVLRDVHLTLVGASGERTDVEALRAVVEADQVVLEGRVVARGPGDRELRSRKLVWRRDGGFLLAEGPCSHTDDGRAPVIRRDLETDLALGVTGSRGRTRAKEQQGVDHEQENRHRSPRDPPDEELAAHAADQPALPARGAGAAGGGLRQQQR